MHISLQSQIKTIFMQLKFVFESPLMDPCFRYECGLGYLSSEKNDSIHFDAHQQFHFYYKSKFHVEASYILMKSSECRTKPQTHVHAFGRLKAYCSAFKIKVWNHIKSRNYSLANSTRWHTERIQSGHFAVFYQMHLISLPSVTAIREITTVQRFV